jgi:hypothetical protein
MTSILLVIKLRILAQPSCWRTNSVANHLQDGTLFRPTICPGRIRYMPLVLTRATLFDCSAAIAEIKKNPGCRSAHPGDVCSRAIPLAPPYSS